MGAPVLSARSITLTILSAFDSDSDPPKTVKSCAKTVHRTTVDQPISGDEAVAVDDVLLHTEVAAPVADKLVELFKRPLVEQEFDTLTGA